MGGFSQQAPRATAAGPASHASFLGRGSLPIRVLPLILAIMALGACGTTGVTDPLPLPPPAEDHQPVKDALVALDEWLHPRGVPAEALAAGDTITVDVKNHPEYTISQMTIPADGIIEITGMPGKFVQAIGKTPQTLQNEVAKTYEDLLVKPYVIVNVRGHATRAVYVSGEVRRSGRVDIPTDTRLTLIRALTEAGYLTERADSGAIRILRDDRDAGRLRTSPPIDLEVLMKAGVDIPLLPNDTIQVPKQDEVTVSIWGKGVQRPGTYAWSKGLTITRLIPMAGGLEKFADTDKVRILRREAAGQRTYRVDLDRIFANKDPDFLLLPDDVVRVDDTFF
jgi:polysaccharide biosynthesis/export protein